MRRYGYFRLIEQLPTRDLIRSANRPSPNMNKTHVALHFIALRRRGYSPERVPVGD